ncbi:MAG TPA: histidinol dehydrogenase, partial [Cryptosporangiaceae bacterium]|nr:histidinol dehydrogenase [Cryptosporangiaceae bacterium]
MLRRIDLRGSDQDPRGVLPRAALDVDAALEQIRPVVDAVRERGAAAVREATRRLDGVDLDDLKVPAATIEDALRRLDAGVRAALEEAIRRTRLVHDDQRRVDVTTQLVPGGTVTERWVPVTRVGLYVPGGLAVYPSTVVMNVVPAQVAGVSSLAVASPPQREFGGRPHPTILAACALLGVTEVYAVGGAQAIAMFAHGAGECRPVDLVTGPGNVWVTAAKRLLRGVV